MTQPGGHPESAREAYDAFAPIYDEFNRANDYEKWLGEVLLSELNRHGLRKGTVLDIGCGTGRAFPPLLARGWEVHGCDLSAEMIKQAGAKFSDASIDLHRIDARDLPVLPGAPFDLILALNDIVNYLTEDGDLERAFAGIKRNLAPHGLVCFDANCLSLYEANWVADQEGPMSERGWTWAGLSQEAVAGSVFEAELSGEGVEPNLHRQRHWTREQVEEAMASADLRCIAVRGQREEADAILLEDPPDEQRHYKTIYIGAG